MNTQDELQQDRTANACRNLVLRAAALADTGRAAQGPQVVGEFDDRFVLAQDGWRIAQREARFLLHDGH